MGSPSTATKILASKAEGISGGGDQVCPAALGALASVPGQWLHLPGQVSACAGPSRHASSLLRKLEGWRVLHLSCRGCSTHGTVDVPRPRQCHAVFRHIS